MMIRKAIATLMLLVMITTVSLADPIKGERKKDRLERKQSRKKVDDRTQHEKMRDRRILPFLVLTAIAIFKKLDDAP